jgi:hypothetical protein
MIKGSGLDSTSSRYNPVIGSCENGSKPSDLIRGGDSYTRS